MDPGGLATLAAIGLAAGFIATLLGVGGGLLMVPVLNVFFGFGFKEATALSLAAMVVPAASGLIQHARRGAVDLRLAVQLSVGGIAGVLVGKALQDQAPVLALQILLCGLMLYAAWRLSHKLVEHSGRGPSTPATLALGAGAGIASRLVGIGGGLVTGPVLTLLGTPVHTAVGSSLGAVYTNSLLAATLSLATGSIDLQVAGTLAAGATVAGPLGTWAAHALHAERLRSVFAVALVLAALALAVRALTGDSS